MVAAASALLLAPAVGELTAPASDGGAPPPSEEVDLTSSPDDPLPGGPVSNAAVPDGAGSGNADNGSGGIAGAGEQAAARPGDTDGAGEAGEVDDAPEAPVVPELMSRRLDESGFEAEDIEGSQLIIVKSAGNTARVSAFEYTEDGAWSVILEECPGHVGRNGVSAAKVEGDGMTPMGLFAIPSAFGNEPDPGCLLPYRQATEKSYWVDDPDSASYNMWVEDDGERDWKSAEHISDYSSAYAYAAVIAYNTDPVTPGAGSAIFLHVGSNPTSGCVSVSKDNMLLFLRWLDPGKGPKILIF